MAGRAYILRLRQTDKAIFNAVKNGKKKIETRAGTERYRSIMAGDSLVFVCDSVRLTKKVKCATHFKTITAMLKKYKPGLINPAGPSEAELRAMYGSFGGYKEKIKKYGLVALEL